ncbi:hypothetical protein ACIBQ1_13315 [Nonomuraea sp. NPDC050153]|uniref:hypothetical protein n=1 Tax=Nonomuraea sp. NPDC050153 TaxID=3364359 RepID=UPI00379070DB
MCIVILNRIEVFGRPSDVIPFEMIDEDLRMARQRARRWDGLSERHAAVAALIREARLELDVVGVWDQEQVAVAEAKLGAYLTVLAAVERDLAEVGPARELYEELLAREERRLAASADHRGAELLEIGRLLAELDVELPARERAQAAGLAVLNGQGTVGEFARQVEALGMMAEGGVQGMGGVREVMEQLEDRCRELERLRDGLRARREEVLLD